MSHVIADRIADTTTTTGTGAITLTGTPLTTYRAFSSVCVNGDTIWYAIVHRTADEWEVGLGTSNGSTTLTRTTVFAGSNGTSLVNFSAGTKDVFGDLPARQIPASFRERLTANRTYYVNPSAVATCQCYNVGASPDVFLTLQPGSDANDGLTVNTPKQTVQAAYNTAALNLDFNGFNVVIQLGFGTHATLSCTYPNPPGMYYSNGFLVRGNPNRASDVIVQGSGVPSILVSGDYSGSSMAFDGLKIQGDGGAASGGVSVSGAGSTASFEDMEFGACGSSVFHINAQHGAFVSLSSSYKITGGAQGHVVAATQSTIALHAPTITISDSPANVVFGLYFAWAFANANIYIAQPTFLGGTPTYGAGAKARVDSSSYIDIGSATNWVGYIPGTGNVVLSGGQFGPSNARTPIADGDYSMVYGDQFIALQQAPTAARTITLMPVAQVPAGWRVTVVDEAGGVTASPDKQVTVKAAVGEFIGIPGNGFVNSTVAITQAFGSAEFECNGGIWVRLR